MRIGLAALGVLVVLVVGTGVRAQHFGEPIASQFRMVWQADEGTRARCSGFGLQRLDLPSQARPTPDPGPGRVRRRQGGDLQVRSREPRARLSSLLRRTSASCCRVPHQRLFFREDRRRPVAANDIEQSMRRACKGQLGRPCHTDCAHLPSAMETHVAETLAKSTSCTSLPAALPRGRLVAATLER